MTGTLTATQFNGLAQGTHTIFVHGKDTAGNWGATQTATFFKDTVLPSSSATSPQYSTTNGFTVSYTASDASPSSWFKKVELYVKRPGDSGFSLALTDTPGGASGGFSYTAAAGDGSYSFYTRAYYNAGNVETAPGSADTTTFVCSKTSPCGLFICSICSIIAPCRFVST